MGQRYWPRLRKSFVGRFNGQAVYTIDSFAVRNVARPDEEFGNFATRDEFPDLIPPGELWLDERNFDAEGLIFLANALVRLGRQVQGIDPDEAYSAGLNVDRWLRRRITGEPFRAGRPHRRVPARLYVETYLTLPDERFPITVFLVNGHLVRCWYKTDYVEGGHGYVYRWVPKREIWVEGDLDHRELPFIVTHEYLELRLMRDRGLPYDRAHEIASRLEFDLRKRDGLQALLVRGPGRLGKRHLPRLAAAEVFDFVLRHYARPAAGGKAARG
jgi:hypothetical protein